MKKILLVIGIACFTTGAILAKPALYVTNPVAKLLDKPNLSSSGSRLNRGDKLSVISKSGMFIKVNFNGKTGYVAGMFTSPRKPGAKVSYKGNKSSGASSSRRRASSFNETASARGLTESEKIRVRGNASEYDYQAVQWMESQSDNISRADLDAFQGSK